MIDFSFEYPPFAELTTPLIVLETLLPTLIPTNAPANNLIAPANFLTSSVLRFAIKSAIFPVTSDTLDTIFPIS